jgi:hypothetical protein
VSFILPREAKRSGAGEGDRAERGGGGAGLNAAKGVGSSRRNAILSVTAICGESDAPSTILRPLRGLRLVPLPRYRGGV